MFPLLWAALRTYSPAILLPITATVGFIGYKLEWWIKAGQDQALDKESVSQRREDRMLDQIAEKDTTNVDSILKNTRKRSIFSDS